MSAKRDRSLEHLRDKLDVATHPSARARLLRRIGTLAAMQQAAQTRSGAIAEKRLRPGGL